MFFRGDGLSLPLLTAALGSTRGGSGGGREGGPVSIYKQPKLKHRKNETSITRMQKVFNCTHATTVVFCVRDIPSNTLLFYVPFCFTGFGLDEFGLRENFP